MNYCFILGRNPELSISELNSQVGTNYLSSPRVVLADFEKEIENPDKLMERLYGTIRIAKIINQSEALEGAINNIDFPLAKTIKFSLSVYNPEIFKSKKKLCLKIKKILREKGIKADFVGADKPEISNQAIRKGNLIDFVLFSDKGKFYFGVTVATQNIEEYDKRNYQKPNRDLKSGMMPVKLARMMINILNPGKNDIILDPFCGGGTIIQELLLLGFQNVIGSDSDRLTIQKAEENLVWLKKTFPGIDASARLMNIHAEDLSKHFTPESVSAIITEPYLGPNYENIPTEKDFQKAIKILNPLYKSFLEEVKKILKPAGKIAVVFPAFKGLRSDALKFAKEMGFEATYFAKNQETIPIIKEGQILVREFSILKKV